MVNASPKPREILYAELALWAWTAWACLFGIFQTWRQIPEIEQTMNDQLQGMIRIAPDSLLHMAIGGYAALAALSAFVVYKIGQGKHWARSTTLWSAGLQAFTLVLPPYHGLTDYLPDLPDLGLQAFALYYLYLTNGRIWFEPNKSKAMQRF